MNLLFVIVLIVMFFNIVSGYKKGMVREIISLISLIVMCVVVALIGNGLNSYFDGEIANVIIAVLLLCLVGIVHHLLGVVFFSAKVISRLPVVSWIDKLLGMLFGIVETILILWTIYAFIMMLDMGMIGQQILVYTRENQILTWLYENNYLAVWLERLNSEISFLPS
ncbi:MAG TPA: CvpA family protein [Candidatus Acetatifactor stercoripullorum]|uniref:CvpA family protein n=1 Tax=Candidatus Acetatifactor stercoripullorum TaxID=2838414 RepID=A0A9D1R7G4_9FIRM|nr:CvpA family protein [uncultured Acetatifactor sp.]HIW81908.1 CvpA family protein [Candidatus Acetatifactor stercoripullorum]